MKKHLFLASMVISSLFAEPVVTHGKARYERMSPTHERIESGERAILEWKELSVGEGHHLEFALPGKNAAVLNRVTGGDISRILGDITSNGRVYLINPSGIFIGSKAILKTAAFLASTLDCSSERFMNGSELTFAGSSKAEVTNLGKIEAWDGDLFLVGYRVKNKGELKAPNGTVGLAAANHVLVQPSGKEHLFIKTDVAVEKGDVGIEQSGHIEALKAELKADGNLYALAINMPGKIEAKRVAHENGRIVLRAESGTTSVSGELLAKEGGEISLQGKFVGVEEGATLDVSGESGGGAIFVGGGRFGKNAEMLNAERTVVMPGAYLSADGIGMGSGGEIIIYANEYAWIKGDLLARGGLEGGDGGFIEASARLWPFVDFKTAKISAASPKGKAGTFLFDPERVSIVGDSPPSVDSSHDMTIGTSSTDTTHVIASTQGSFKFFTRNSADAGIDAELKQGDIIALLVSNDVVITGQSTTAIDINTAIAFDSPNSLWIGATSTTTQVVLETELTENGSITVQGGGSVYLAASKNVIIKGPIEVSGDGNVSIITTNGGADGGIFINDTIECEGGNIIIDATSGGSSGIVDILTSGKDGALRQTTGEGRSISVKGTTINVTSVDSYNAFIGGKFGDAPNGNVSIDGILNVTSQSSGAAYVGYHVTSGTTENVITLGQAVATPVTVASTTTGGSWIGTYATGSSDKNVSLAVNGHNVPSVSVTGGAGSGGFSFIGYYILDGKVTVNIAESFGGVRLAGITGDVVVQGNQSTSASGQNRFGAIGIMLGTGGAVDIGSAIEITATSGTNPTGTCRIQSGAGTVTGSGAGAGGYFGVGFFDTSAGPVLGFGESFSVALGLDMEINLYGPATANAEKTFVGFYASGSQKLTTNTRVGPSPLPSALTSNTLTIDTKLGTSSVSIANGAVSGSTPQLVINTGASILPISTGVDIDIDAKSGSAVITCLKTFDTTGMDGSSFLNLTAGDATTGFSITSGTKADLTDAKFITPSCPVSVTSTSAEIEIGSLGITATSIALTAETDINMNSGALTSSTGDIAFTAGGVINVTDTVTSGADVTMSGAGRAAVTAAVLPADDITVNLTGDITVTAPGYMLCSKDVSITASAINVTSTASASAYIGYKSAAASAITSTIGINGPLTITPFGAYEAFIGTHITGGNPETTSSKITLGSSSVATTVTINGSSATAPGYIGTRLNLDDALTATAGIDGVSVTSITLTGSSGANGWVSIGHTVEGSGAVTFADITDSDPFTGVRIEGLTGDTSITGGVGTASGLHYAAVGFLAADGSTLNFGSSHPEISLTSSEAATKTFTLQSGEGDSTATSGAYFGLNYLGSGGGSATNPVKVELNFDNTDINIFGAATTNASTTIFGLGKGTGTANIEGTLIVGPTSSGASTSGNFTADVKKSSTGNGVIISSAIGTPTSAGSLSINMAGNIGFQVANSYKILCDGGKGPIVLTTSKRVSVSGAETGTVAFDTSHLSGLSINGGIDRSGFGFIFESCGDTTGVTQQITTQTLGTTHITGTLIAPICSVTTTRGRIEVKATSTAPASIAGDTVTVDSASSLSILSTAYSAFIGKSASAPDVTIDITASTDINVTATSAPAFIGVQSSGTSLSADDIHVQAGGNISVLGGGGTSSAPAMAYIGVRPMTTGVSVNGGKVRVTGANNIIVTGGASGSYGYSIIGFAGVESASTFAITYTNNGSVHPNVLLSNIKGNIQIKGGRGTNQFAAIGFLGSGQPIFSSGTEPVVSLDMSSTSSAYNRAIGLYAGVSSGSDSSCSSVIGAMYTEGTTMTYSSSTPMAITLSLARADISLNGPLATAVDYSLIGISRLLTASGDNVPATLTIDTTLGSKAGGGLKLIANKLSVSNTNFVQDAYNSATTTTGAATTLRLADDLEVIDGGGSIGMSLSDITAFEVGGSISLKGGHIATRPLVQTSQTITAGHDVILDASSYDATIDVTPALLVLTAGESISLTGSGSNTALIDAKGMTLVTDTLHPSRSSKPPYGLNSILTVGPGARLQATGATDPINIYAVTPSMFVMPGKFIKKATTTYGRSEAGVQYFGFYYPETISYRNPYTLYFKVATPKPPTPHTHRAVVELVDVLEQNDRLNYLGFDLGASKLIGIELRSKGARHWSERDSESSFDLFDEEDYIEIDPID